MGRGVGLGSALEGWNWGGHLLEPESNLVFKMGLKKPHEVLAAGLTEMILFCLWPLGIVLPENWGKAEGVRWMS